MILLLHPSKTVAKFKKKAFELERAISRLLILKFLSHLPLAPTT